VITYTHYFRSECVTPPKSLPSSHDARKSDREDEEHECGRLDSLSFQTFVVEPLLYFQLLLYLPDLHQQRQQQLRSNLTSCGRSNAAKTLSRMNRQTNPRSSGATNIPESSGASRRGRPESTNSGSVDDPRRGRQRDNATAKAPRWWRFWVFLFVLAVDAVTSLLLLTPLFPRYVLYDTSTCRSASAMSSLNSPLSHVLPY
jgi:hypothetical protein